MFQLAGFSCSFLCIQVSFSLLVSLINMIREKKTQSPGSIPCNPFERLHCGTHCDRQVSWDNDMLSPLPNEVYCMQEPGRLREKGGRGVVLLSLSPASWHQDTLCPFYLHHTLDCFWPLDVCVCLLPPQAVRPHTRHEGWDVIAKIQYKGLMELHHDQRRVCHGKSQHKLWEIWIYPCDDHPSIFFLSAAKRHLSRDWPNLGLTPKPTKKAALLMHYAF